MVYLNDQKYKECQLVTAINAAHMLGEPIIDPDSHEYERLVCLIDGREAVKINVEPAYKYLRLNYIDVELTGKNLFDYRGNPLGVCLDKGESKHMVLITNVRKHPIFGVQVKIKNWCDADPNNWVSWFTISKYFKTKLIKSLLPTFGKLRIFSLINDDKDYRLNYLTKGLVNENF